MSTKVKYPHGIYAAFNEKDIVLNFNSKGHWVLVDGKWHKLTLIKLSHILSLFPHLTLISKIPFASKEGV